MRRKTSRLFSRQRPTLRARRTAPASAFSDARADAVVTVLQLLARSHANPDRVLLERISRRDAASPNDAFIRDAAAVCLERHFATTASGKAVLLPTVATKPVASVAPTVAPVALAKRQ